MLKNTHAGRNRWLLMIPSVFAAIICCFAFSTLLGAGTGIVRILPLGDSITQSDWNYRRLLWKKLIAAGYNNIDFIGTHQDYSCGNSLDFDMDNEGWLGYGTKGIVDKLPACLQTNTPDIVLLHIGTNDLSWSGDNIDVALVNIKTITGLLRAKNQNVVIFLAKIIPHRDNNDRFIAFNSRIQPFADSLSTTQSPIITVDQYTGMDTATVDYGPDGIHPDSSGAEKMAAKWFDALIANLPTPVAMFPYIDRQSDIYADSVMVTITAGTGVAIRYTTDGSAPTKNSQAYRAPFVIRNSGTMLKARGYLNSDSSTVDSMTYTILYSLPQPSHEGLYYKYYEYTGPQWDSLKDLAALTPVKTGYSDSFQLDMRNRDVRFALHFGGTLKIDSAGFYSFGITANSGCKLYIDGICVVNDNGVKHLNGIKFGQNDCGRGLILNKGDYPITLDYYQDSGSTPGLTVVYQASFNLPEWKALKHAALFSDSNLTAGVIPGAPDKISEKSVRIGYLQNGTISIFVPFAQAYDLRLMRMDGRIVKTIVSEKAGAFTFTRQDIMPGVYLIKIGGVKPKTIKFVFR